jgi:hypothetical protein
MEMQQGYQPGHAAWTCSMEKQHNHTAWKIEMVHFDVHFHIFAYAHVHAYVALTRITMQHGHEHRCHGCLASALHPSFSFSTLMPIQANLTFRIAISLKFIRFQVGYFHFNAKNEATP